MISKDDGDGRSERPPTTNPVSESAQNNAPQNTQPQKRNRNRKRHTDANPGAAEQKQADNQSSSQPTKAHGGQKKQWVPKAEVAQVKEGQGQEQPASTQKQQRQRRQRGKDANASQKEADAQASNSDPFAEYLNTQAKEFDPTRYQTSASNHEEVKETYTERGRGRGGRGRGEDRNQGGNERGGRGGNNRDSNQERKPRGDRRQQQQSQQITEGDNSNQAQKNEDSRPLTAPPLRGGGERSRRGERARGGNQPSWQQGEDRPQTSTQTQDKNPQPDGNDKNKRKRNNRKPADLFEEQKTSQREVDRDTANLLNKEKAKQHQHIVREPEELTQMRGKRAGNFKSVKQIGSAANYIEDENRYTAPEKIQMVQRNNDRGKKDKAKIMYNYKDFLSQFQGLTEQCVFYTKSLATGTQECTICSNFIYQRAAIWNCQQCYTPFHMGCIHKWIQKLNKPLQENIRDQEEEERKAAYDDDGYDSDSNMHIDERAKKLLAFYSWTCPNCNFSNAENRLPTYQCYCGRFTEPAYNNLILPHSCGEICEKQKNANCTHTPCNVLCHPGACPPCNISVPVTCFCEKEIQRVPCHVKARTKFSCGKPCLQTLNCGKHQCMQSCHDGPCQPCADSEVLSCFCGTDAKKVICGTPKHSCKKICNKKFECGQHSCQKICHSGACGACPFDPERVLYCPSGHQPIQKLLGRQRKSCTEPIPTCKQTCDRYLPCGKHQCKDTCHNGDCAKCEASVIKKCPCGKEKRTFLCYEVNYSEEKREKFMSPEQASQIDSYKCHRVCNKMKNCQKHKCQEICCPIDSKSGWQGDPLGKHRCQIVCDKLLSCGKHNCPDLCHIGNCKPCTWVSVKPVFCPCNIAKLDPPVKCGMPPPTCGGPCKQKLQCGHQCSQRCHNGKCPPCMEPVTTLCNCGKEVRTGVFCYQGSHNCGQTCGEDLGCGHKCQKVCHTPGKCITSKEELLEKGCGQRCGNERSECGHKCIAPCHLGKDCPTTPCEAEISLFCKCGKRYVTVICNSLAERDPIECNARCWKLQRDENIAKILNPHEYQKYRDTIKFEYYPDEAIEFAQENMPWVKKIEAHLTYCVLNKSSKSYSSLSGGKRRFLDLLVHEHFMLDMCSYGQQSQKRTTDVFYREGSKVPEIMCSEIADLVNKGIEEVKHKSSKTTIFEATINVSNVPLGNSIDTLKKFLVSFKNEMYTEKGKPGCFAIHFYQKHRARDALAYMQNSPNQFSNCYLTEYRKEIGTLPQPGQEEEKQTKRKGQQIVEEDEEGWSKIVK